MEGPPWALQRLRATVRDHLRVSSAIQVGSRAVQSAADVARQWGAGEAAMCRTLNDAINSSAYRKSNHAHVLRKTFLLT